MLWSWTHKTIAKACEMVVSSYLHIYLAILRSSNPLIDIWNNVIQCMTYSQTCPHELVNKSTATFLTPLFPTRYDFVSAHSSVIISRLFLLTSFAVPYPESSYL